MIKFRRVLFIGFIGFFLIGFIAVLTNSLKAGRKPSNEWEWGAKIIGDGIYNLYGHCSSEDGWYWDSDENIVVKKGTYTQRRKKTYYFFQLFIYPPANGYSGDGCDGDYVYFQNVVPNPDPDCCNATNDGEPCGFPNCDNPGSCDTCQCMVEFLNNYCHPYPGYHHFMIQIWFYEDIENMGIGETKDLTSVQFFLWNRFVCDNPDEGDFYYHTIDGKFRPLDDDPGFTITRTDDNIWEVEVISHPCLLEESYCEEELVTKGKGKNSYYAENIRHPLEALTDPISLKIEFTRKLK